MLTALDNPRLQTADAGWLWEAKDKTGKRRSGWTRGPAIKTQAQLLEMLQTHFGNLDFSDFKCERRATPPVTTMLRPVPASWFEFGTNKLVAEILAGLRPDMPGIRLDGSYQCAAPPDRTSTPTPAVNAGGKILSVPAARVRLWRNRKSGR